jgi:hypothetical protein
MLKSSSDIHWPLFPAALSISIVVVVETSQVQILQLAWIFTKNQA